MSRERSRPSQEVPASGGASSTTQRRQRLSRRTFIRGPTAGARFLRRASLTLADTSSIRRDKGSPRRPSGPLRTRVCSLRTGSRTPAPRRRHAGPAPGPPSRARHGASGSRSGLGYDHRPDAAAYCGSMGSVICLPIMKTTVEIADALGAEAKRVAAEEGTTLRALIEAGLRLVLEERRKKGAFELRDASFRGCGLQPEFREVGWDRLREAAYGRRGG